MKRIIDRPQQSDMGSGFGHIEGCEGVTLSEALDWIEKNNKTWGTISIYFREKPIRIFDYNTYSSHEFYHHMNTRTFIVVVWRTLLLSCDNSTRSNSYENDPFIEYPSS